ncbi:MAG: formate/nitrite transporter family protein [Methanomicrobiales archaeon]|jgi:formate/nitrite transporter|nr:formate/nitrite transporter family protein [Methanomicrobiales archaeon]
MTFNPPVQIVAKAAAAGTYKVGLTTQEMLVRGFMSGAYIAMGAALATVASTGAADFLGAGVGRLILGATFPVGLIITVLTGAELFTGDAMFGPLAALIHKTSWAAIMKLWVVVYIGNLIGSLVVAYMMAYGPLISVDVATGAVAATVYGKTAIGIASAKVSYSFGMMSQLSLMMKAIGCNWLVNLAVFLGICADDVVGKFFGIWFPIMAFVTIGFEHSVANMYFIPAGLMTYALDPAAVATVSSNLNWVGMWTNNIIVVTIGNIIGAMFFVAFLYWLAFKREVEAL